MAASNSAEVEKLALGAGMKKGGSAKGELVLAMYELANCFRNGWGIKKDPAAAKQYYETAANLGDTDAMNEVAWCYTEGFGTKKDKVCSLRCVPMITRTTVVAPLRIRSRVRPLHRSMYSCPMLHAQTVSFGSLHLRVVSISSMTRGWLAWDRQQGIFHISSPRSFSLILWAAISPGSADAESPLTDMCLTVQSGAVFTTG
jgi:hypothetical protein